MKSIPLALTWEFWRQVWSPLLSTVLILVGLMALIYEGFRIENLHIGSLAHLTGLDMFCFIFIVVGVVAVICGATAPPQFRFTLPVSMRASILVPTINGAIATAISYLAVALLVNLLFDAQWALIKPTIMAVCLFTICQTVAWMIWTSANLRASIVAGVCTGLAIGVIILSEQPDMDWHALRPIDLSLAIIVPILSYSFTFGALTLAHRGQFLAITAIGRWLLSKLDVALGSRPHRMTPMAAALWSEWTTRGQILAYGILVSAAILCAACLFWRIEWQSARDAILALTWLQMIIAGPILGLFLGHVGPRFDFHEYLATRPLSDAQLADVKLWNALKALCWTWAVWVLGVAVVTLCLTIAGQGPASWNDIVPPGTTPLVPLITLVMIPLCGWTLTSLGVSVVILRPRTIKAVLCTAALLPFLPLTLSYFMPQWSNEIVAASQWTWTCAVIVGTTVIYAATFRLRLITAKRIALVGLSYLLFCAICLLVASFLPTPEMPLALAIGFLLSSCILPFVCVAAVPLAIWWNRHR
ncbi:MAG: hypothetical protein WD070_12845 [Pirellulaceae bacterium]